MMFLCLLLLATQSFALQYTVPSNFGGKTDFSERTWRYLVKQLSPDVNLGQAPVAKITTKSEPTCAGRYPFCSTTYFGKELTLKYPTTAQLWVKWHQDATPFGCDTPAGCTMSAAVSIADLTSQTTGWSVTATINAKIGTNNDKPKVQGDGGVSLTYQYSDMQTTSTTLTSGTTLSSLCEQGNLCFLQTGTLMMSVSGLCTQKPLIVCNRDYFPCEEFNSGGSDPCPQWADFTRKYCIPGSTQPTGEQCSMNVAVYRDDGLPVSYQVFEQVPIGNSKRSIEKREFIPAQDPFGTLPDGSSGALMAWTP